MQKPSWALTLANINILTGWGGGYGNSNCLDHGVQTSQPGCCKQFF